MKTSQHNSTDWQTLLGVESSQSYLYDLIQEKQVEKTVSLK